ncbi:MAG: phage major capsid protein [Firmicutes bacterium]|nr:phage major capsid protein [Bacillota bacterium]
MTNTFELRKTRTQKWDGAKAFLESKRGPDGSVSDEDYKSYEKMEAEVLALGRDIETLERQYAIDRELAGAIEEHVKTVPSPELENTPVTGRATAEYRRSFLMAMRKEKVDLDRSVLNALSIGTDTEGGYLVPDEFERTLVAALEENDIMRTLARVITTTNGTLQIPLVATRGTASWVEEAALIPESDSSFAQTSLNAYKLATLIKVSRELLEDSAFSIEAFLADDFGKRLGALEEEAFFVGDGVKKPTGILMDAQIGHTAASADGISFDDVIKLYYSLRSPYRNKAVFAANEKTVMKLRMLKGTDGQYIWQPSVTLGAPDMLLGRPVYVSSYIPEMAADAKVLIFGDFTYYWIGDRRGRTFERLNELFALTDQVGFKATQRVDGKLILPEAVKVLQMGGGGD